MTDTSDSTATTTTPVADCLIYNARRELYWRANREGYTRELALAGLYVRAVAKRLCRTDADNRERVIPLREVVPELRALGHQIDTKLAVVGQAESDRIMQALKNSGVDVDCGACLEVAFTGVTTNRHTCGAHADAAAVTPIRIWALRVPFNKNGFPVFGQNFAARTTKGCVIVPTEKWTELCQRIPDLAKQQFEVGTAD